MARRFVRSSFARSSRKGTDWSASSNQVAPIPVASGAAVLLEVFTPIVGGETVIRTRGMLAWATDQAAAVENQFGAFGIGIVTEQAATVGITAVPHPASDAAWDGWLYHTFFFSQYQFLSSVGAEPGVMHSMVIDSKAARKVGENDRMVTVVENTGAAHGFDFANSERFLSKLH